MSISRNKQKITSKKSPFYDEITSNYLWLHYWWLTQRTPNYI